MKHLMVLGLTASVVALASCSSDELIQAPSSAGATPIALRSGAVNKSTRGNDINKDNIQDFKVTGWIVDYNSDEETVSLNTVFDEEEVTKQDNSEEWTYGNTQYWVNGAYYDFNAYAPADAAVDGFTDGVVPGYYEGSDNSKSLYLGGTFTFTNKPGDAYTKESTEQARRRSGEEGGEEGASSTSTPEYYRPNTDLLYAQVQNVEGASNAVVDFTFNHALARVKFKFANTFTNKQYSFEVKDIVFHNAIAVGECTIGKNAAITWAEPKSGDGAPRKTNEATNQDNASGDTNTNVFDIYFGDIDELKVASSGSEEAPRKGLSRDDSSETDNAETDHYYIIPVGSDKKYTVTFDVNEYVNGTLLTTYTHDNVELPDVSMAAGNSYVYSLEIDGSNIDPDGSSAIKFTVSTVNDWGDDTPEAVEKYITSSNGSSSEGDDDGNDQQ